MLPASDLTKIITNLTALKLDPTTAAAVLDAVLAPLLRNSEPEDLPHRPARTQRQPRPKRKKRRRVKETHSSREQVSTKAARNPSDGPRGRALAALRANPDASLTAVAKAVGCSRSTVVNARDELAAQARKRPSERRERAQRFLREQLGRGPRSVSDIEAAASRAHIDEVALGQARGDLGVVVSRGNAGGVQAVQWSLPG